MSRTKELKERKLSDGDRIYFTALTKEYGKAEFNICPVYKRGKLKKLYLYPRQQPYAKEFFVYTFNSPPLDWSILSWVHQGLDEPFIWLHYWCKEHKCASFSVYTPPQAKYFEVHALSNFSINFGKRPEL